MEEARRVGKAAVGKGGGYKCCCCGPAREERSRYRRTVRRIGKRILNREIGVLN